MKVWPRIAVPPLGHGFLGSHYPSALGVQLNIHPYRSQDRLRAAKSKHRRIGRGFYAPIWGRHATTAPDSVPSGVRDVWLRSRKGGESRVEHSAMDSDFIPTVTTQTGNLVAH